MKKEDLDHFTEEHLLKYLATFKKRVKEMRQLTVQLQRQNVELAAEYTGLVNKKKMLYNESLQRKGLLMKWYSTGKRSVSGWINKFQSHQPNSYEPQIEGQEPLNKQEYISNQTENADKTVNKLNFEHLYSVSKEKIGQLIQTGGTKVRQLTSAIKQKYQSAIQSPSKNPPIERQSGQRESANKQQLGGGQTE